ncbi:MAG: SH3 domain-containing protein [Thermodesulfobacteriota bacterium]
MSSKKLYPLFIFTLIFLSFSADLTPTPEILWASPPFSKVPLKMERPQFWIKKIQNPNQILLSLDQIQKMNDENLKKPELYLCKVSEMKEEWTKEEVLSLLREDWEGFGRTEEVRYSRRGNPLGETFWNDLKENLNQGSLDEIIFIQFGLILKRTDIRVFPTQEASLTSPHPYGFDRFQHSSLSPGALVGVFHRSKDNQWVYAQCGFIRGWIRLSDVAIARKKSDAIEYDQWKDRCVITNSFVPIYEDPKLKKKLFIAQMGSSFPLLTLSEKSGKALPYYVVKIPLRGNDGYLIFGKGYLSKKDGVHRGFLPYTQENIARQAFKMLHEPYGWGEMFGGRDCSRFIMDIFSTFGFHMPRNSKLQAMIGIPLLREGEDPPVGIKEILDKAIPLATLLRFPGHIMLYLGKEKGKYYVIHSLYGIQKVGKGVFKMEKIGKVVVSDLSLGKNGVNGPLLDRITDIRIVALDSPVTE